MESLSNTICVDTQDFLKHLEIAEKMKGISSCLQHSLLPSVPHGDISFTAYHHLLKPENNLKKDISTARPLNNLSNNA